MNKTININLGGILFHVNENAYQLLNDYLLSLKNHFSTEKGAEEIMNDIEIRFAEIFQEKITTSKNTINLDDVQNAMDRMGKPENFNYDERTPYSKSNNSSIKRIFRDEENSILGGVCSGLSHYLGLDTVIVRIILLILLFVFGTGALIYLILWIVIPAAKTTSDKLAMHGQPVSIDNIQKQFQQELNHVNSKYGGANTSKNINNALQNTFGALGNVIKFVAKFISILFLGFFSFIGIIIVVVLFNYIFGENPFLNISDNGINFLPSIFKIENLFDNSSTAWLFKIGVLLSFTIPVFLIIYHCIRLLIGVKNSNPYITRSSLFLWLLGVLFSIVSLISLNDAFKSKNTSNQIISINNISKTLVLKVSQKNDSNKYNEDANYSSIGNMLISNGYTQDEKNFYGKPDIKILKSENDSAYIVIGKSSNAKNKRTAADYTDAISYNITQIDSIIMLDNIFKISNMKKFRNQKVVVKIYLPANQKIYLDKSVKNFLDDVENISNTWDGYMPQHTWQMQPNGLKCIDYDFEKNSDNDLQEKDIDESINDLKNGEEVNLKINGDGVYINGKRVKDDTKMNDKNIDIDPKNIKVEISKNGISADIKADVKEK